MIIQLVRSSRMPGHLLLWWTTRLFASEVEPVQLSFSVFGENNDISSSNTPLIITHGLFGSKANWRGIARALESQLKKRVYTVDLRNHGDSPHSNTHNTSNMAADFVQLIQQEGLQKTCIMGHSMGGRSMMYLALKYPHLVDRGIIVDISPISIPRNLSLMEKLFTRMKTISISSKISLGKARKIVGNQIRDVVDSPATADFITLNLHKNTSGEFFWSLNVDGLHKNLKPVGTFFKQIAEFPPFHGPMLFICGKHSKFFDPDHWPQVQKIFPNAEIEWINAGHIVHFDQPTEFIDIVVKFLK